MPIAACLALYPARRAWEEAKRRTEEGSGGRTARIGREYQNPPTEESFGWNNLKKEGVCVAQQSRGEGVKHAEEKLNPVSSAFHLYDGPQRRCNQETTVGSNAKRMGGERSKNKAKHNKGWDIMRPHAQDHKGRGNAQSGVSEGGASGTIQPKRGGEDNRHKDLVLVGPGKEKRSHEESCMP